MTEDLVKVSKKVGEELTRKAVHPAQHRYVYAPYLVELGEKLLAASKIGLPAIREDVLAFAGKMSAVMDMKIPEKEGRTNNFTDAMCAMECQLGKFHQTPFPSQDEIRRTLIHIANYAMIASGLLK